MTDVKCQCPVCGAYQQVPRHVMENNTSALTTCLKCGAIYAPDENIASMSPATRNDEVATSIHQIAADVKFMADHLRRLYLIADILLLLWVISLVLRFFALLGGCRSV